jgi:hypothetical protein
MQKSHNRFRTFLEYRKEYQRTMLSPIGARKYERVKETVIVKDIVQTLKKAYGDNHPLGKIAMRAIDQGSWQPING